MLTLLVSLLIVLSSFSSAENTFLPVLTIIVVLGLVIHMVSRTVSIRRRL